jgi:hypothetical protein
VLFGRGFGFDFADDFAGAGFVLGLDKNLARAVGQGFDAGLDVVLAQAEDNHVSSGAVEAGGDFDGGIIGGFVLPVGVGVVVVGGGLVVLRGKFGGGRIGIV